MKASKIFDGILGQTSTYCWFLKTHFFLNPAYGRQRISPPMRIVGPIQFWRGYVIFFYIFFFRLRCLKKIGGGGVQLMRGRDLIM